MPEPASSANTNSAVTYTDDHLSDLHKTVASNLQNAGVDVPFEAVKPIHVPDGTPVSMVDQVKVDTEHDMPGSFNSTPETAFSPLKAFSEHLDYADQVVTGRTHVIDEADRFSKQKGEKEQKRMEQANAPKTDTRGPVKKLVDWLHH